MAAKSPIKPPAKPAPHPLDVIKRSLSIGVASVCVGVSTGKDSIANLAICIEHFGRENVHPFFLYLVPGLSFQERYLAYLERFFSVQIIRLPHWCISGLYRGKIFRHPTGRAASMPAVRIRDIESYLRQKTGVQWFATGEKATDSLERNAQIRNCDGINVQRRKIYPLAYWNHASVYNFLKTLGVALPPDYSNPNIKTSFGGLWYAEVSYIRDRFPEDYAKVRQMFPLIEAQMLRYELKAKAKNATSKATSKAASKAASKATNKKAAQSS